MQESNFVKRALKSLQLEGGKFLYSLKMVNLFGQDVIPCFLSITEEKV